MSCLRLIHSYEDVDEMETSCRLIDWLEFYFISVVPLKFNDECKIIIYYNLIMIQLKTCTKMPNSTYLNICEQNAFTICKSVARNS